MAQRYEQERRSEAFGRREQGYPSGNGGRRERWDDEERGAQRGRSGGRYTAQGGRYERGAGDEARWSEGRGYEGRGREGRYERDERYGRRDYERARIGGEGRRGYAGPMGGRHGGGPGEHYGEGGYDEGVYQGQAMSTGYGYGHYQEGQDTSGRGWSGRYGSEGEWRGAPRREGEYGGPWTGEVGYGYGGEHHDPHFHSYMSEHLSRYDSHYRTWRDEQARRLRDEYDKYRAEQQNRWSKEFESWRGNQGYDSDFGEGGRKASKKS